MAIALVERLRAAEPAEKFEISYPNDVLRNGLKVAGILAEARGNFVIGVGLNQGASSPEFGATGTPVPLRELADDLLRRVCGNLYNPDIHARFYAKMRE